MGLIESHKYILQKYLFLQTYDPNKEEKKNPLKMKNTYTGFFLKVGKKILLG